MSPTRCWVSLSDSEQTPTCAQCDRRSVTWEYCAPTGCGWPRFCLWQNRAVRSRWVWIAILVWVAVILPGPDARGYRFFGAVNEDPYPPPAAGAVRWDDAVWAPGEMLTWVVADDPGWTASWTDSSGATAPAAVRKPGGRHPFRQDRDWRRGQALEPRTSVGKCPESTRAWMTADGGRRESHHLRGFGGGTRFVRLVDRQADRRRLADGGLRSAARALRRRGHCPGSLVDLRADSRVRSLPRARACGRVPANQRGPRPGPPGILRHRSAHVLWHFHRRPGAPRAGRPGGRVPSPARPRPGSAPRGRLPEA